MSTPFLKLGKDEVGIDHWSLPLGKDEVVSLTTVRSQRFFQLFFSLGKDEVVRHDWQMEDGS